MPPWDSMPWYITSFQSSPVKTWNTVNKEITNVSKLASGVPSEKLNAPPKSCIPKRANIRMKRKRRNRRERMDLIELRSDITKFLNEDQYFVTLKILKSLRALKTDNPALAFGLQQEWKYCLFNLELNFCMYK